ncbi:MAG: alpha/beta hydrolase [Mycobacteriales bacterium]|nr:alpha/beta hydrolase [Mycobacteriales bacterium]
MSAVELVSREVGSGRPLVLLHAFPLSSAMWLAQREHLSSLARVVTPDLRGFGGSPLGFDEPSLDRSADDVVALLDRLGLDRVVLGGLSMGGYIAMALLRSYPERVEALVLADTKATADPEAARANRLRIADAVVADGTGVLVEEVLPKLLGATSVTSRPHVVGRVKGLVQSAPPPAVAWAQRAMAARPDSLDVLRSADVPALVVVGDEDELSSAEDAQAMVDALPQGRLAVLPGSGHLTAVEVPDTFNLAVSRFLADL